MKWSSSSNSSLSNGTVVTMPLNNNNSSSIGGGNSSNSNNNHHNSSISSSGSNTSSNFGQNGGGSGGGIIRTSATVRRHESDRRSVFYTDPHDMEHFLKSHGNKKMSPSFSSRRLPTNNGIITKGNNIAAISNGNSINVNNNNGAGHSRFQINSAVSGGGGGGPATEQCDGVQKRKCENLISYFTIQIHRLNKELEIEKRSRDIHLAKIAKALLCFEAKLKNDQKQIRQQLYEKDTQLNRLASEVISLREKCGVKDGEKIDIDPVTQYCSNCRKQYYCLSTADVGVQVKKYGPNCRDDVDKENNVLPTSSSEDGLGQVFSSEVRRSRRYMSKRTSGTFREYLNSRNIDLAFNCSDESFNRSSESNSLPHTEQQMEFKPLLGENKPAKDTTTASTTTTALMRKGSMRRSSKSVVAIKCDKNGNKLDDKFDDDIDTKATKQQPNNEINGKIGNRNNNGNNRNGSIDTHPNGTSTKIAATSNNSFLKKYIDDVSKPKNLQFESTDDWYASASDMDDSDGAVSKPYGYNAVNPVLECVNQILLQQSMDGIMESCANKNDTTITQPTANSTPSNNVNGNSGDSPTSPPREATTTATTTNTLKKRVHFSTQNSMVQVPRSDSSNLYRINTSIVSNADNNVKDLSYATIYSNDYEPIGSENNSTNHYVDMDSKLGDDRPIEKPKTMPPALPPKPPNLLKFRQILKMPTTFNPTAATTKSSMDNESEPDYCSIGDVQEAVKSVQIVADVHKNADDDTSSHASEETKMTDETFADVPKLPNVVALLSPKKDTNNTTTTITASAAAQSNKSPPETVHAPKSNPSLPRAKPAILPTKAVVANLLCELNAQKAKGSKGNQQLTNKPKIISELDESTKKSPLKLISQQKMSTIVESNIPASAQQHQQQQQQQQQQTISANPMKALPIIKQNDKILMPIQAEFDWYNLDMEYNKLLPTNILENGKETDAQDRVEYNLDAEFSLTSCSDNNSSLESSSGGGSTIHFVPITVAEEDSNNSITTSVGNGLLCDNPTTQIIVDDNNIISTGIGIGITTTNNGTDKNNPQLLNPSRLKKLINKTTSTDVKVKSYDSFLEQTGLTAKPLPQKRKIFYNAPFV